MPNASRLTPETIARMSDQLVGTSVAEGDRPGVAELVGALLAEMTAMRELDVEANEPATIYQPTEP